MRELFMQALLVLGCVHASAHTSTRFLVLSEDGAARSCVGAAALFVDVADIEEEE